jgi:molecular chaperone GrpE
MDKLETKDGLPDEDVTEIEFVDIEENDEKQVPEEVEDKPVDGIAVLEDELAHMKELYLRKLAEFDNFRKRIEREKTEMRKTAGEDLIQDLLPVLDNFERALEHSAETAFGGFKQGVEMISKQLLDVLGRRGLERFDPTGEPFEPEFHEAIQRVEESQYPPGTVAWCLSPGYLFGGRLLRAAMVGVSVASENTRQNDVTDAPNETDGTP